ncbi:MAG: metallophosphoesterase family protein [Chloroflexota bacterium]
MKIALISDIHGNLHALEAVLAEIKREGVEQIICLGDVAAVGPQPKEVIARLRELECPVVMGNTDAWMSVPEEAARVEPLLPEPLFDINEWALARLSTDDIQYMHDFPMTLTVELGGGHTLLCFHGSPNSYNDIIQAPTLAEELDQMIGDHHATILAGGHTHTTMLRRHRDMQIVNPGSVGSPLVVFSDVKRNPARVEYALITNYGNNPTIEFRHVLIDVEQTLQTARDVNMPQFDWWAASWR